LTQTDQTEKVVISSEPSWKKENIIKRKTIVYETQMDPTVARVTGERLKQQLFAQYGFFKPKSEDIQFISLEKFYEPYVVISGKYVIDYFRKSNYILKVDDGVKEVVILNNKFVPQDSRNIKLIELYGEERLVNERRCFQILDKNGRDATVVNLPSAPSEKNPEKAIEKYEIMELPENEDVDFMRTKIVLHPENISRIIEEIFEINERTVIYTPRFKIIFKNIRTNEEKTLVIDGVSSKRIA
jgi:hypothetical protein